MNLDTMTRNDLKILISAKEIQEKENVLKLEIASVENDLQKTIDLQTKLVEIQKSRLNLLNLVGNVEEQQKYFSALNEEKKSENPVAIPVYKSSDKVSGKSFKKYHVTFDWSYGGRFLVQNESEEKVSRMISHLLDNYNLCKHEINKIMMDGIWSRTTCEQYSFQKTIDRGQYYIETIKKNIRKFLTTQNVVTKKTEVFLDRI